VLAVLAALDDEQYGYSLKQFLADRGVEIDEGTLYPLLRRLETQGLLQSRWVLGDGRPRRYYKLNAAGGRVVKIDRYIGSPGLKIRGSIQSGAPGL
jgi:PadR family transcriptional regulator